MLNRRRALMAASGSTPGPVLPAEYQRVEYIEAPGGQCIETDIVPNSAAFSFNIGFYKASQANTSQAIIAGYASGGTQRFSLSFRTQTNKIGVYSSSWNEYTVSGLYGNIVDVKCAFDTSSPYASGTIKVNGSTTNISKTSENYSDIGSGRINFFNIALSGSAWASYKLYYCRLYKNNNLFADFVPCYRKSDGVIGLYETVGGKFYLNSGSGTFLKGADV